FVGQRLRELDGALPAVADRRPEGHRVLLSVPHDEIQLLAALRAQTLLDLAHDPCSDPAAPHIGVRCDVIQPPTTSVESNERNRVAMDMNSLLIRDADHVVVVETGAGSKLSVKQREIFGIETPRLLDELKARGVGPAQVTLVVNTHLHFDHSGGNTYRDGEKIVPTFPRASYVFQRLEWEDAMHANERTRGSYLPDDYAP